MKQIILAAALVFAFIGSASAQTCEVRAAGCMTNGGTRDVCYGAPLANCKKTGTYVGAYSGKSFSTGQKKICPPGTCAGDGSKYPLDVKNCKASNCR